MQLTVPGNDSAGRDRLLPWRDMYRISPANPARSQSTKVRLIDRQIDIRDTDSRKAQAPLPSV